EERTPTNHIHEAVVTFNREITASGGEETPRMLGLRVGGERSFLVLGNRRGTGRRLGGRGLVIFGWRGGSGELGVFGDPPSGYLTMANAPDPVSAG
ncbi:hypothetical protein H0H81_012389, partial [Sphagnurus paluster]